MMRLVIRPQRAQADLPGEPYDRWISPAGEEICAFHRIGTTFCIRFPEEVDFLLGPAATEIEAFPAGAHQSTAKRLFDNAIVPLLGNHHGGLFLHGSAVLTSSGAAAFLGSSRSGKTTLAGAFAKSGCPFLTEDVVDLKQSDSDVVLTPKRSPLRLFEDSAAFLTDAPPASGGRGDKASVEPGDALPFSDAPAPLAAIFVLGGDHNASLGISRLSQSAALPAILPHAFVLDVEDKARMRGHFGRIADLAQRVPVYSLDYPRAYSALPETLAAIERVTRDQVP